MRITLKIYEVSGLGIIRYGLSEHNVGIGLVE
jgi:hypothetical protein